MTKYERVIPRDFFNEAKLLKCMGVISLAILDNKTPKGIEMKIEESGEAFEVVLLDEGSLTIANYPVKINGELYNLKTTYNSKANYPLFFETLNYEDILVLDESGNFTVEFIEYFTEA